MSPQKGVQGRWFSVAVYLVVCFGLLVLAGQTDGARPFCLIGAAVMFGFALWSAWRTDPLDPS